MKVTLLNITKNPVDTIYMGYRVCYSKNTDSIFLAKHDGYGAKKNFILPLIKEGHSTPFEHVSATFLIEGISRACLAQLTRHRTMKFNVQSQRYVDGTKFDYVLPSLDYLEDDTLRYRALDIIESSILGSKSAYGDLVNIGVKKEDARSILPQATTCNLMLTVDMNNFRKFLTQRLCNAAQTEIRLLANEMADIVSNHIPFIKDGVMLCNKTCNRCFK